MHTDGPRKAATGLGKRGRQAVSAEAGASQVVPPNPCGFRATLLVGASILAVTGVALAPTLVLAQPCVPSNQVITTSIVGPVNSDGGSITITESGSVIPAGGSAISANCSATTIDVAGLVSVTTTGIPTVAVQPLSSVGTLNNSGSLISAGIGGVSGDRGYGISNAGTITQLTNSGVVNSSSGFGGIGNKGTITQLTNGGTSGYIYNDYGGTVGLLTNNGTITGGVGNLGTLTTLTNNGVIVDSVVNWGTMAELNNNGTVGSSPNSYGILAMLGSIGRLNNSGTVIGVIQTFFPMDSLNNSGIVRGGIIYGETIGLLTNSGTISGGIGGTGTIGTLTNSGTISGSNTGISNDRFIVTRNFSFDGTIGVLTNSGVINGSSTGISNSGNVDQLTNSGVISGGFTGIGAVEGTIGTLTNSGVISGGDVGVRNLGIIRELNNSGTISGTVGSSGGVINSGSIDRMTNSGTISGGIINNNGGTITLLTNSGTISGGSPAIINTSIIGMLTNSGNISGSNSGSGISNSGTITLLTNSGNISGDPTGISNAGNVGQLTNSGTVTGGQYAIFSSGIIGPITNSGIIVGNIEIQRQDVTIQGGSGAVFGMLTGGNITVSNGNLLFASGNQLLQQNISVNGGQGTVTNSGNLMLTTPQSITGNYVQGSAGSLIIGVSPTSAGRLDVSGTASMVGATVVLQTLGGANPGPYTPPLGQQLQIISAQGGVQGSLVGLSQPSGLAAGTRFDVLFGATSVSLMVTPSSYANLAALGIPASATATTVGNALDAARPSAGAAMTPSQTSLYTPLYTLGADQIAPTLEQMAPVIYADALTVNRSSFQMVSTAINRELEARRGAPPATRSSSATGPQGTTIWLGGIGQFLRLNGNSNDSPGYSGSSGGVVAGIDGTPWPDVRIGAAFGFSSQNISTTNAASYRGNAAQFQVYGSARHDIAFLDAQAGGVFTEGTARRTVFAYGMAPEGNVSGSGGGGSVRGGVRVEVDGWNLEPSVLLGGLALGQGGVAETNGGPVGMQIGRSNIASLQSLIGIRVDRRVPVGEITAIVPSVRAGWGYEMLDTRVRTTASFLGVPGSGFDVSTPSLGRNTLVVGAQAALDTGTALQLFASYTAALNSNATAQTVTAGLRYTW